MPISEPLKVHASPKATSTELWISPVGGMIKPAMSRPIPVKKTTIAMASWILSLIFSIVDRIGKGSQFGIGVNEIKIMTSENPNIALLRDLRMRDNTSRISWWWYDDKFEQKYGPFKQEDTVKVLSAKNRVNEEDGETPEEVEPQTAEEVIDQIEDTIKGVEDVKDIGNDKVVVSIP